MKKPLLWVTLGTVSFLVFLFTARVKTLECTLENTPCPDTMITQLNALDKSPLFLTNFKEKIPSSITDETILLTSYKKKLPSTLIVNFTQEQPNYVLAHNELFYTVYNSGMYREVTQPPSGEKILTLTLTFPLETITTNNTIKTSIHEELQLFSLSLYKASFTVQNSTWIDSQTIQLELPEEVVVLLPFEAIAEKVKLLESILKSTEIKSIDEPISEIDLRYKYPVLRTQE